MFRLIIYLVLIFILISPVCGQVSIPINKPECATWDSLNNRYLISMNVSGAIMQIDTFWNVSLFTQAAAPINSASIKGNTFYQMDMTSVTGYNLSNGFPNFASTMAGSRYFGGCAADTSGFLYAPDIHTNAVKTEPDILWKVDLSTGANWQYFSTATSNLGHMPRDVVFDAPHNRLLVIGATKNVFANEHVYIQEVNLTDSTITNLVRFETDYSNGIAMDQFGNTYAAGYDNGTIYRYDSNFTTPPEVIKTGYDGPCNIDYNRQQHILAIPNYFGDYVEFLKVGRPKLVGESYNDASGGDGDGMIEGGETIELVLTFENTHFLPLTDFSINLLSVSGGLTVTQNLANMGTIPARSYADNSSTPLVFEVPADYESPMDSFHVEITYTSDYGTEVDTVDFGKPIGQKLILLVDGDGLGDVAPYYEAAFDPVEHPFDTWDATVNVPSATFLQNFNVVVWFTGNPRGELLNADEIAVIKSYLDNGGGLFLTGQGLASHLDTLDQDFLNNYLHSSYVGDNYSLCMNADASGEVFAVGEKIKFGLYDAAANQEVYNRIDPAGNGVASLICCDGFDYGAVSQSGGYRTVFFSFGFEAISDNSLGYTDRSQIMSEIITYLNCLNCDYTCGDANGDGNVNIVDASFLVNYIFFSGAAPDPVEAGDANNDGSTNIVDASYIVNYIFFGGTAPCETA